MPEINIAITLDKNYLQHAAVMLYSLGHNNKNNQLKVYAICDEAITENDWNKLKNTYTSANLSLEKVMIDVTTFKEFKISAHASAANYYRIQLGQLLPASVKKVLYLDVDIVVLDDLTSLYNTELSGNYLAAVEDFENPLKYLLGLEDKDPYLNSGIMLIDLELWRTENLNIKLADYILNNPDAIQYWDQDAINAICKGHWSALPPQYNLQTFMFEQSTDKLTYSVADMQYAIKHPVILHYTGRSKPWEYMNTHPRKQLYYEYLKNTPWKGFKPKDQTMGNTLRKYKLMPAFVEKIIQRRK